MTHKQRNVFSAV